VIPDRLAAYLEAQRPLIEDALDRYLPKPEGPAHRLAEAMRYSVFAGGKRLRPALVLLACEVCGGDRLSAVPPACAVEIVHTYSLIHDDLPAMDDDDFRRGRPSCHRAFDEATAILAGDALLTLAFDILAQPPSCATVGLSDRAGKDTAGQASRGTGEDLLCHGRLVRPCSDPPVLGAGESPDTAGQASRGTSNGPAAWEMRSARLVAELARGAGTGGMLAGQMADMAFQGKSPTAEAVDFIHRHKTAALLASSVRLGAIAADAPAERTDRLGRFGEKLGLAFQIADDALDVQATSEELGKTAGKDIASGKVTYPAVFGLEESHRRARQLTAEAMAELDPFGPAADLLRDLARYVVERKA